MNSFKTKSPEMEGYLETSSKEASTLQPMTFPFVLSNESIPRGELRQCLEKINAKLNHTKL